MAERRVNVLGWVCETRSDPGRPAGSMWHAVRPSRSKTSDKSLVCGIKLRAWSMVYSEQAAEYTQGTSFCPSCLTKLRPEYSPR